LSIKSSLSLEPLRLELKPSGYLRIALSLLALGALGAIFYSAIDGYLRLLCAALLLVHWRILLRRHSRLSGHLIWGSGGWLWVEPARENLLLLMHATVWPGFIALRFRDGSSGKQLFFSLLPDSLEVDMQRRLRLHLRHMPVFGENINYGAVDK
jgi:membrane-bound toxin of toxin-antitoxin system